MRLIHTSSRPVMHLGVYAHQHFDAVSGPCCYLSGRDAGVEAPGDAGSGVVAHGADAVAGSALAQEVRDVVAAVQARQRGHGWSPQRGFSAIICR